MRLDTETLQAELMQAQAVLSKDRASLAKLQAGSRREDIAEARATLKQVESQLANAQAGASPEEIAQAQAQLDSAQANRKLAQERIKRYQNLRNEGVIALDLFDEQIKNERQAIADVESAQRRLSQLKKGRNSEMDRITSEVEEKRQNLRRLENGPRPEEIAQAKAQVAESLAKVKAATVKIQQSKITAPFTGVVGYIPTKVGDYVKAGDKLTFLTQNNALEINLSVPLDRARQLRLGLPVQILDSQGKSIAAGKVSFISPNVNTNAQTILARASFNNFGQDLLNRQLVQAKIIWSQGSGILIPAIAVSRLGEETSVFIVQNQIDKKTGKSQLIAQKRAVKLGEIQNNSYQVLAGLKAGEKLIIAGLINLQDGMPIMEAGKMSSPPK
jgi:RND family efflux transporter MFP subunit